MTCFAVAAGRCGVRRVHGWACGCCSRIASPARASVHVCTEPLVAEVVTGVGWALAHEQCAARGQGLLVSLGFLGARSVFVLARGDAVPAASVAAGHVIAQHRMEPHSLDNTRHHMWVHAWCDDGEPAGQPPENAPLHHMHTVMFHVKLPRLSIGAVTSRTVDVLFGGGLEFKLHVCVTAVPTGVAGATAAPAAVRGGWVSCVMTVPEPAGDGRAVVKVPVEEWAAAQPSDPARSYHLTAFALRGAFVYVDTVNGAAYKPNVVLPLLAPGLGHDRPVSPPSYNWLLELERNEYSIASQNGEDGVLEAIFGHIGVLSGAHLWDAESSG